MIDFFRNIFGLNRILKAIIQMIRDTHLQSSQILLKNGGVPIYKASIGMRFYNALEDKETTPKILIGIVFFEKTKTDESNLYYIIPSEKIEDALGVVRFEDFKNEDIFFHEDAFYLNQRKNK